MSSVFIVAAVCLVLGVISTVGAYIYGQKKVEKKIKDELAEQIDQAETRAILMTEAKDKAENANLAKSAFLANMSHELRTPLNGIIGLTDILVNENLTPKQTRKIDLIHGSSETLLSLLNDILDISKIESGSIDIESIDVGMHQLMREVYEFWFPIAEKKKLNLLFQKQKDMPDRIVSDPTRIRQCLDNLINNALKFTPEGGQVTVKAKSQDQDGQYKVSFSVQDSGPGISQENISKLFKPFMQAEAKTSRKFGGTGLGLAITKNLCEMMGGDVLVRSEVGVGTIFRMSFIAKPSDGSAVKSVGEETDDFLVPNDNSLKGLRCLIAEDNPVNLEVLRLLLEPYELDLVETTNGREALKALETQFFDIILMDLQMPLLGGKNAVRQIRQSQKHYANIPVIAMTANAMEEDRKECFEIGFNAFLTKPLKRSELISTIDAVANLQVNAKKSVA